MSDARRRCELEQARIRADTQGNGLLNAMGDLDWEIEKQFHMEDAQMYDLNYYRDLCHNANVSWWPTDKKSRDRNQLLALCVSELSEALEGHRKGKDDDHLPHRKMAEVELVDFLIRAFDMAGGMEWDLAPLLPRQGHQQGDAFVQPPPYNPYQGPSLNAIGATLLRLGVQVSDNFSECLMRITGLLVDCHRYKNFEAKQVEAMLSAIKLTLAVGESFGFDLQGAFDEKMSYNARRVDHTLEHRAGPGGKKY